MILFKSLVSRFSLSLIGCLGIITLSQAQKKTEFSDLAVKARSSLEKGTSFYHSIAIEGGYVYHYTLDLKEKWGEGKTDDRTIEVQPPGTPAVGMTFLRAYRVTKNPGFLQAAEDAANALIRGQNDLGGWEHRIHFDRPTGNRVSFDDDQTQSAISFLMALDQEINRPELSAAIEKALKMMLASQLENGGWPHQHPPQGNYHDYATFNDGGINDCIRVMLEAHRYYGKAEYLESLKKVGRFLLISQLPPPQPGWAQQYNEYLQPAWARSFEPPSVCPLVTVLNLHSLIDLYIYTGNDEYLEAIPDPIRWMNDSRLPNGKWGRFLELYTNKALYYDRGRIRADSLMGLSLERRTGYRYEVDLYDRFAAAEARYLSVMDRDFSDFPASDIPVLTKEEKMAKLEKLAVGVREIIQSQDKLGRWISFQDSFRKKMPPGQRWDGEYRTEDRISSELFNRNVGVLCEFLELYGEMK